VLKIINTEHKHEWLGRSYLYLMKLHQLRMPLPIKFDDKMVISFQGLGHLIKKYKRSIKDRK
jgi:hypothetical protein